jgi:thiopurine S-methyltransferase
MDWLSRWEQGKIGWHETQGNPGLRKFWPKLDQGSRVLVPLCGKSPDLLWLAEQGCDVTGVELSEIAAEDFFNEAGIRFEQEMHNGQSWYRGVEKNITIVCGDYFQFTDLRFDALYDRAALVAVPPSQRSVYIKHTKSLLHAGAPVLLVTLEYDQSKAGGPPFSVLADEVRAFWPGIQRVFACDDIDDCPPKFRQAGIREFVEVVWLTI